MSERPTVTLCMIVKDEEHIICECLESIYKQVDGMTLPILVLRIKRKKLSNNSLMIKVFPVRYMTTRGRDLVNQELLRFENAAKGKADYAWVIDADDRLEGDFKYPEDMTADSYALNIHRGEFNWWRNQIFRVE